MFSKTICCGRFLSAVTPQQYIVPDFALPPYSSQTAGHDGTGRIKQREVLEVVRYKPGHFDQFVIVGGRIALKAGRRLRSRAALRTDQSQQRRIQKPAPPRGTRFVSSKSSGGLYQTISIMTATSNFE